MADEGTYLEDFLISLEMLPNNFRRECELLKELDKEVLEASKDLAELESKFLDNQSKVIAEKKARKAGVHGELSDADLADLKTANDKLKQDIDALRDRASVKIAEKTAIALNLITVFDQFSNKLDSDIAQFEADLKGAEYEPQTQLPPQASLPVGVEVAFRVTVDSDPSLGQVLQYRRELGCYDIQDVDDKQKFTVPETQVYPIGQLEIFSNKKLSKGDRIHALYPDTTIFYPALVIQAPRRNAVNSEAIVTVQFEGDADPVTGQTPHRVVQLKYIVRMPI